RRIAYKNVKIAFPDFTPAKINRVVKKSFKNAWQHFIEILYLPWIDNDYLKKYVEVEGAEDVLKKSKNKKGKGVIFLGLHFGSWEISSAIVAKVFCDYNSTGLARPQKNFPLLNDLLNSYRSHNYKIMTIDDDLRPLLKHLKKGFGVGIIGDHGGTKGGILVDFFGRPAYTPIGAIKLALKLDTNVVVGSIIKKGGARHKMTMAYYDIVRTGNDENDVKINLENVHRIYEDYIREAPDEYLWFFKRWKQSPQKNILVLSDGKAGHLKQSQALVELIKILPFNVKAEVVEIHQKSILQKVFFYISVFFSSKGCQGCMWCLKSLCVSDKAQSLLKNYYDVVISCGSGLAMINRCVAFENMARSIVIMKPGIFSFKRFDLVILPEHDRIVKGRNVVSIKGAITTGFKREDKNAREIIAKYGLNDSSIAHPVVGLVIGGDNSHLKLDVDNVKKVVLSLKSSIDDLGGTLLVSTSRRTSAKVEQFLKDELKCYSRCKVLFIANEDNPQGSFEAILSCSDMLIVSADSISMVSECLGSGKHTLVFKLNRKISNYESKHERFIDSLERENYISVVSQDNIENKVKEIWREKPPVKKLNKNEVLLSKLKEIL
ncbi:ELM1/GtrOC1 family putative glycosyltransferase, partial [Thermoproteota archaeon]